MGLREERKRIHSLLHDPHSERIASTRVPRPATCARSHCRRAACFSSAAGRISGAFFVRAKEAATGRTMVLHVKALSCRPVCTCLGEVDELTRTWNYGAGLSRADTGTSNGRAQAKAAPRTLVHLICAPMARSCYSSALSIPPLLLCIKSASTNPSRRQEWSLLHAPPYPQTPRLFSSCSSTRFTSRSHADGPRAKRQRD
jgi:hypothetical protein